MPDTTPPPSIWSAVESYLTGQLIPADPVLDAALADATVAGLPAISVTTAEGRLLYLLARLRGARRILEVGTLGGFSTIWLARALPPEGQLLTLEINESHAAVARRNIERAGLSARVEVRVAPALDTLAALVAQGSEPFDLVFIDADKENSAPYFDAALQLTRPGALIVVDNVVREGEVVDADSASTSIQGIRLMEMLEGDTRVEATAIQTVGSMGHDGMLLAIVTPIRA